ncbi:MAG TPA: 3-methyladenine DNA glycosylase 2, partial [Pseudomonadota bacterium]|nr:3-methyladenine DNA glycosylase 2 [Pseudomonadota bacterium]
VRAVLGQQVSVSAARNLAATLCAAYGEPVETAAASALGLSRLFPTPQRLLGADLSELGMPQARKSAIIGLATATVADPDLFSPKRSLDEAVAQLRALPGIGEWTAQYIAMRALREPDAFPHTDVALLRALTDKNGQRPSPEALLTRAEQWRPWRAYAASHLWAADAAAREEPSPLLENRHDD